MRMRWTFFVLLCAAAGLVARVYFPEVPTIPFLFCAILLISAGTVIKE